MTDNGIGVRCRGRHREEELAVIHAPQLAQFRFGPGVLLRALGLTRRQLRRMLAAEAVLLSVVATLLGTVVGVGFAWVGYETFVKQALSDATMQVPWLSLGVVVLIAALAGLLVSALPARRADRVTPAAGLSLD